ncbi:MAG: methionyl-tRNA formyltransferase [Bacteroidetes bacterium]|nr:MAG: methionyl-tRNA formyltransferase [Bacteroidota bacterium]REJ99873.1 MAG: methionyl-tRNA formyltransferase [Bacteroidota bacterium]REK34246.1 MAG: methionyl-tRNA formyltransferase [Bacteroidota bacterium]REK50576.1 MAG: methionyl-tRNA formyltransferase [Bacteroidota bacterium]
MNSIIKPGIVFFGTPDFAVPCLEILHKNQDVVAVVTAPDKPAGRGNKLSKSPVKVFAEANGIQILQPEKLKSPEFLSTLSALKPGLFVVVAFRMLPEQVWSMPSLGTFNLHASLLPQYRGAAPINWAIINGETKTGLTTFFIRQEIDTGDILLQEEVNIGADETAGELHDRMMIQGANLVNRTVELIYSGNFATVPQDKLKESDLKSAPKLNKENTRIHFTEDHNRVRNLIRGLSPFPGAHCKLQNIKSGLDFPVKILKAKSETKTHSHKCGRVITDNRAILHVAAKDGIVSIEELQLAGRNKVSVKDFLNGFKLDDDWEMA